MKRHLSFFQSFFKHKRMVGAVIPSSSFLAEKMLGKIDFSSATLVVEFGPGNGVFTRKILAKMRPDARLIVYELNAAFYEKLKAEVSDPRMTLIHGSAESIRAYVNAHHLQGVDCIISSLPLANFPPAVVENILASSHAVLRPDGKYIQFQYTPTQHQQFKQTFSTFSLDFTLLNVPPALVYTCTK